MEAREFLTSVLPGEGYIIVSTPIPIPNSDQVSWRNVVVPTIDAALAQCAAWVWENRDTYFAMATFKKEKVWNPLKLDWKSKKPGAYERRTQSNVRAIKTLFLDIDVKPGTVDRYQSQAEVVGALRKFCDVVRMPKPMLVSSGRGVHVYWLLDEAVTGAQWKPAAELLKSLCIHHKLQADHGITADEARVLRVPGTYNFKRAEVTPVRVLQTGSVVTLADVYGSMQQYVVDNDVSVSTTKVKKSGLSGPAPTGIEGNIGVTNDPINAAMVMFGCQAFANQVATHGSNASEPQWRAALGIARFCEPPREAMLAVSDGHGDFDEQAMNLKVANWTAGPSLCTKFWAEDNATCEACPQWRKISSPAQLGRTIREAPMPLLVAVDAEDTVTFVKPPKDYHRKVDSHGVVSIAVATEDSEGNREFETIFPYDLYPIRILRQTGVDSVVAEKSVWRVTLPRVGEVDVSIPLSMLSDTRRLHGFWLDEGAHINPIQAKATQFYMSAYIQDLAKQVDREKVYERLGWHDDHRTFVTATQTYHRDGTVQSHNPSKTITAITKGALHPSGVLEQWRDNIRFYAGDGNENNRFFLMSSLGAPLFHMTGHKGVLVAASGDSGRGKSTCLEACASIWGDPEPLLISGGQDGTTTNALYSMIGTYHSLPLFWDDTTERDADDIRKFLLNISQGKGKERMKGHEHDGHVVTWETIVLSSANTDDVSRIIATGKDSDPHLMRMVSVGFDQLDRSTEMKLQADIFRRRLREHYGLVGPIFLRYIVKHYKKVQAQLLSNMEAIDRKLKAESQERYWTATLAAAFTAGQIAYSRGLIPFNPVDDLEWMCTHVTRMRTTHNRAMSSPADILNEYLEKAVNNTLILSSKSSSNLDNIMRHPHAGLYIRVEADNGLIYVSRNAMMVYCAEANANFRKLEDALVQQGIVTRRNCHKVLGAETPYAKGQTRCWQISEPALRTAKR